jgi:DNA-binding HxlR family transcriptional regulator
MAMMKSYGQFCSIAKALEVVGERWTPLVLRELICGASRYNEIQRGVPRISPTLLSKRLSDLERAGVIARDPAGRYALTEAGRELKPVIEQLGVWGQRWARGRLADEDFDPDLLMWDMRRRIDLERFPKTGACLKFEFTDCPKGKRHYWLVGDEVGLDLCVSDPGHPVDLYVTCDIRTMTRVWNGDLPLRKMISDGKIELHGPLALRRAFPGWLMLGIFAAVPAAKPAERGREGSSASR